MRNLCHHSGGKASLLISLRKGITGNYRGITLLSVVGKVFCKVLNERLVTEVKYYMKVSCIDNIYTF